MCDDKCDITYIQNTHIIVKILAVGPWCRDAVKMGVQNWETNNQHSTANFFKTKFEFDNPERERGLCNGFPPRG